MPASWRQITFRQEAPDHPLGEVILEPTEPGRDYTPRSRALDGKADRERCRDSQALAERVQGGPVRERIGRHDLHLVPAQPGCQDPPQDLAELLGDAGRSEDAEL